MFADDMAIVANDAEGLQEILRGMEKYVERNMMEVHVEKSKRIDKSRFCEWYKDCKKDVDRG